MKLRMAACHNILMSRSTFAFTRYRLGVTLWGLLTSITTDRKESTEGYGLGDLAWVG